MPSRSEKQDSSDTLLADTARYAPGSFGCHEALHMSLVLATMVDRDLADHPAIESRPEWKALADRAMEALNELYQVIGREHLEET